MRHVHESDIVAELEFAREAGAFFAADVDKKSWSYSNADPDFQPGMLLALRWGMGDDCVLVVRLHDVHEATIYAQMARPTEGATP